MQARPTTSAVVERLTQGDSSVAELSQALQVSQPTLSRAIRALERSGQVLRMRATRGARYALHRLVGAVGAEWPIYRIDEHGTPRESGHLHSLIGDRYFASGTAEGPERLRHLTDGFPYFLQDMRPAGFLGRAVPAAFPELGLPGRVVDWTDDHVLIYLTERGTDTSGNLILGAEALNRYLAGGTGSVLASDRSTSYPACAVAAMAGAPPGSSAQGEHPKFTALIEEGDRRTHVIVKFSPPRSGEIGQRWADLLNAEHLAHRVLEEHGISACRSSVYEFGDRVFLECERFDRIGARGRRGAVSLFALDSARYGKLDNWSAAAGRLADDALLVTEDAERIRLLDAFGALTANTDRHFGNVTLFDHYEGRFDLAPVYDMLPMLFAPQDGQILPRTFTAPTPTAAWLTIWDRAHELAQSYWDSVSREPRISAAFRDICAQCLTTLRA